MALMARENLPVASICSPHPSFRRAAQSSERAGQLIGPDRVVAPIRIDGPSRRCREEWTAERMHQDGPGKDFG
jgi:hypothetical protein